MERLLAIWCPGILEEQEHGREARVFGAVVAALEAFATRVDPVRPGVCAVPTRGPSRYFGGDEALARMAAEAVAGGMAAEAVAGPSAGVGVADGLFAAVLAARAAVGAGPVIVPAGETPSFLVPWPVSTLDRPELADLLVRLGVRTLGAVRGAAGPPGARPFRSRRCPLPAGGPGDRRGVARVPPVLPRASAPDRPGPPW